MRYLTATPDGKKPKEEEGVGDFHKDNTVAIIEATYNIYFCLHLLFLCSVIYMISTSFENESLACT